MKEKEILDMLWNIVDKPKNEIQSKVINVFDNAYRINIWCETYDELQNIKKIKIGKSYFCRLIEEGLVVVS